MLKRIINKILRIPRHFGIWIIIRQESKFNSTLKNEVKLTQEHINNIKVVLDREVLLTKFSKNSIVAELGVDKGDFSQKIISLTKPKTLYLIDIWKKNNNKRDYVKKRFKYEIEHGSVVIRQGSSVHELKSFASNFFDWVYIDTGHSYKLTLDELETCRLKVKKEGIIAGHDYSKGTIYKALEYGVVRAVNEFCVKYDWEFIYITHEPSRDLSFAIRKSKPKNL